MSKFIKSGFIIYTLITLTACYESKKNKLQNNSFIPKSQFSIRGVSVDPLKIDFKPEYNKNETEVQFIISTQYNIEGPLFYTLQLGPDVEILSGQLNGKIINLSTNESQNITIKLKGFVKEFNRFIKIILFTEGSNRKVYSEGIFSTQNENSFEKIVQEVEEYKKENQ